MKMFDVKIHLSHTLPSLAESQLKMWKFEKSAGVQNDKDLATIRVIFLDQNILILGHN